MRARYRLTAKGIQGLPPGKYPDGGNLWFLRRPDGGAQWTFRFTLMGRSREMGLGSYPDLTLAEAREEAETWRKVLKQGIDPLSERQRLREEASATLSKGDPALEKFARQVFDRHKGTLRGGGKRGRWLSPLEGHVFPKIGKRRISTITAKDVADVLRPIWKSKHPTAEKAIQRLGIVFREARDKGYTIQAEIIEKAKADLPKIIHKTTHISATPWRDIPALYEKIGQTGHGASYDCLLWLILNPVRATAARGARFSEIHDGVWIIPAERMKAREGQAKDFHLPLSSASLALLEEIRERRKDDLLFPSYRARSPISDAALTKILNEIGESGRVHGFRTSFRTWVQEETETPWDLAETALAHKVGDSVSESYARGKMLKRLGALYDQWGRFVTKAKPAAEVVNLQAARA